MLNSQFTKNMIFFSLTMLKNNKYFRFTLLFLSIRLCRIQFNVQFKYTICLFSLKSSIFFLSFFLFLTFREMQSARMRSEIVRSIQGFIFFWLLLLNATFIIQRDNILSLDYKAISGHISRYDLRDFRQNSSKLGSRHPYTYIP